MLDSSSRPRIVLVFGAIFVSIGVVASACSLYAYFSRGPVLIVAEPDRRLPRSDGSKSKPKVTFELRNAGNETLQIPKISTTCGCAVANMPKRKLAPGETTQLEVTAVRPDVGVKTVSVYLKTNSRSTPLVTLTVTGFGELAAPFVLTGSDEIYFRDLREPGAKQGFFLVANEMDREAPWIQELTSSMPFVHFRILAVETDPVEPGFVERTYRLEAEVVGLGAPGTYKGVVRLGDGTETGLQVICEIPEPYAVSPRALYYSFLPNEASQTAAVILQRPEGLNTSDLEVTTSSRDVISVDRSDGTSSESVSYRVTVHNRADAEYSRFDLTFRILAQRDTETVVHVPIVVTQTTRDQNHRN